MLAPVHVHSELLRAKIATARASSARAGALGERSRQDARRARTFGADCRRRAARGRPSSVRARGAGLLVRDAAARETRSARAARVRVARRLSVRSAVSPGEDAIPVGRRRRVRGWRGCRRGRRSSGRWKPGALLVGGIVAVINDQLAHYSADAKIIVLPHSSDRQIPIDRFLSDAEGGRQCAKRGARRGRAGPVEERIVWRGCDRCSDQHGRRQPSRRFQTPSR